MCSEEHLQYVEACSEEHLECVEEHLQYIAACSEEHLQCVEACSEEHLQCVKACSEEHLWKHVLEHACWYLADPPSTLKRGSCKVHNFAPFRLRLLETPYLN